MPWRNGGGVTRELVVQGEAPFDWRVSAATIAADGPFSEFPGIDRILVLLRGAGMRLDIGDGSTVVLDRPGAAVSFPGEAAVAARLHDGATIDLNLMWRRDRFVAALQADLDAPAAEVTVVHVVDGAARVMSRAGAETMLRVGDTAWWAGDAHRVEPDGGSVVRFDLRGVAGPTGRR